jgi:hypothetical protein
MPKARERSEHGTSKRFWHEQITIDNGRGSETKPGEARRGRLSAGNAARLSGRRTAISK